MPIYRVPNPQQQILTPPASRVLTAAPLLFNQVILQRSRPIIVDPNLLKPSRIIKQAAPVGGPTFNDSGSGTLILSGSGTESFVPGGPAAQVLRAKGTGQLPVLTTGAVSQISGGVKLSLGFTDSGAGTLTLSGSALESYFPGVLFPFPTRVFWEDVLEATKVSRIISFRAAAVVYNDSGTGTLTLSGSSSESFTTPQRRPFYVQAFTYAHRPNLSRIVKPPPSPAISFSDSGTGTITLTGTSTESSAVTATGSGTLTLSGSGVDTFNAPPPIVVSPGFSRGQIRQVKAHAGAADLPKSRSFVVFSISIVYGDAASGTLTLSGTRSESFSHSSTPVGSLTLSGSFVQSYSQSSSGTSSLVLGGSASQVFSHTATASGTLTFTGTGTELYAPPGFQQAASATITDTTGPVVTIAEGTAASAAATDASGTSLVIVDQPG